MKVKQEKGPGWVCCWEWLRYSNQGRLCEEVNQPGRSIQEKDPEAGSWNCVKLVWLPALFKSSLLPGLLQELSAPATHCCASSLPFSTLDRAILLKIWMRSFLQNLPVLPYIIMSTSWSTHSGIRALPNPVSLFLLIMSPTSFPFASSVPATVASSCCLNM